MSKRVLKGVRRSWTMLWNSPLRVDRSLGYLYPQDLSKRPIFQLDIIEFRQTSI